MAVVQDIEGILVDTEVLVRGKDIVTRMTIRQGSDATVVHCYGLDYSAKLLGRKVRFREDDEGFFRGVSQTFEADGPNGIRYTVSGLSRAEMNHLLREDYK